MDRRRRMPDWELWVCGVMGVVVVCATLTCDHISDVTARFGNTFGGLCVLLGIVLTWFRHRREARMYEIEVRLAKLEARK